MLWKKEFHRVLGERNILLDACHSALAFALAALEAAGQSADEIERHSMVVRLKMALTIVKPPPR